MAGKAVMRAISTSSEYADPGDGIRAFRKKQQFKRRMLDQGRGKYVAPVRYRVRRTLKNIGDKIEDVTENLKSGFQRNEAEKDASGKRPGRNSAVNVCTSGGKCQQ